MTIEQVLADNAKAMNFVPTTVNYPINLGFPSPIPAGFFEFAIIGKQDNKRKAIPEIMKLFESNDAPIVSIAFFNDGSVDQFGMNVICDLNSAKCPPDELLIRVNKSKYVKVSEMSPLEGRVFGRFSFPLTFFGEIRALAIDADRFVHLSGDLTKYFGAKAKSILFEEGRIEGREIIQALREKLGERSNDRQFLFENAKALFQSAGWGKLFLFVEGGEIYKVTINDPPCDAEQATILGNHFLQGLVAGLLEPFLKSGVKLSSIREAYEEEKKDLVVYYMDKASIQELAPDEDEKELEAPPTIKKVRTKARSKKEKLGLDSTAEQVSQIIKSISQLREVKKEIASVSVGVVSEEVESAPAQPAQGGLWGGGGIQIIQQVDKPPLPKRKKKAVTEDDAPEYSSTDTVKF